MSQPASLRRSLRVGSTLLPVLITLSACAKPSGEALWVEACTHEGVLLEQSHIGSTPDQPKLCLDTYKRMPPGIADAMARWFLTDDEDPPAQVQAWLDKREDMLSAFVHAIQGIDAKLAAGEALPAQLQASDWPEGMAVDPWGGAWVYKPGEGERGYDLCSKGADNKVNTADDQCASVVGSAGYGLWGVDPPPKASTAFPK